MCDQQRIRSACAYAQTDQSLCWSLKYSMTLKLLTKPHLRYLSLKGGCTGSPVSTLVKMPHCWKSHVTAQLIAWYFPGLSGNTTITKLQTNPWHREEEPHNNHETPGRQTKQSNQLSLPHRDDCKTTMDTK